MDWQDHIVLITGASRGIGAETARQLSARGARVIVSARKLEAARLIAKDCPNALGLACDVGDYAQVEEMVAQICQQLGPPSVLVNNAGVIDPIGPLATLDPGEIVRAIQTNLTGAAFCARAVLTPMMAAGRGRIVNISSGAAHKPREGWSIYCAAKAGLAMLTRAIALEYGPRAIHVFGLAPGIVDTEMQTRIRASGINPVSRIPRAQLGPVNAN